MNDLKRVQRFDLSLVSVIDLIFWFVTLLVALAFATAVHAQSNEFRLNKPTVAGITLCLNEADAVAILETERDEGREAGEKKFLASDQCANLPVEFTPKRIVATVKTARGTARVVEIVSGEKTAYWITYSNLGFKET